MTDDPVPHPIRIGIDVGGTFTDAVAVDARTLRLIGQNKTPTSHDHPDGVAHGIIEGLHRLLDDIGRAPEDVVFLAHGTTQATNALLEGDVAPVGLIGIGSGVPALFLRRLAAMRRIELTPGSTLPLEYGHLRRASDTAGLHAVLDRFAGAGISSVVVTEPFSVDDPAGEETVAAVARERGFLVTATHDITSLYGLSKRTRTAVLNAVILPRMFATADLVQRAIEKAGITAPLMVMRCDGGVMSLDEMRRRPLLTVLSGPAAGVAGALMQEHLGEGIFLETGGTSTDVSVVRRGKVAVRYTSFGGSTTYLNALDVRTVGIGGGSMVRARLDGSPGVVAVGPRSAHIAGLPYACFAGPGDLAGAELVTVAPRPGDRLDHVALDAAGGRYAITLTCAANALGVVPADAYARADPISARLALEPLARALGVDVPAAARRVLETAAAPVTEVVAALVRDYGLEPDAVRLVGGGGGAAAVMPFVGERDGREWSIAGHSEVISPIGVALALLREQVERIIPGATDEQILGVRREAEQALLAQGAAAGAISVDVTVDPQSNTVRAIATGATELRTQDLTDRPGLDRLGPIAARSLRIDPEHLEVLAQTPYHVVYGAPVRKRRFRRPRRAVRIVDRDGVVRFASPDAHVVRGTVGSGADLLASAVTRLTSYGDGGARAPAVQLIAGPTVADLSGVLDESALIGLARSELDGKDRDDDLVAVLEVRR
ncbi:hydantoinase/oxoprolinase family protein [Pseudonocardia sp. HH130630-07]|uniref:hydantoinase/oxoprolinase family protein n=1 Tax=Pseudonocardia sp. HH130630-07 TaxID=1690815 RepID=UPI000814D40D|nr:hydantoinase/oxoprolinase family protein [Pseudonocardia sp. HH130630-07]ANY08930.1 hydantoinase [Pseudonocardia sp. HH130630-07]